MLTLASDFGSPYPAAMRAAIARHSDADILDVAHDFPRQDVRTAAFWLREILPYVPAPAVHCAVVDPGVGSDRAAIALRVDAGGDGEPHALVAPDNGLVLPAVRRLLDPPPVPGSGLRGVADARSGDDSDDGSDGLVDGSDHLADGSDHLVDGSDGLTDESDHLADVQVFEIAVEEPASSTFHGRDVFAPAAARIHERGVDEMDACPFLDPTEEFADLRFPDPSVREDGVDGEVLAIDGFGNAITNVSGDVLAGRDRIEVGGTSWPVADHYAAVEVEAGLVTVGSHGNVELAVNRGRGADRFDVAIGDPVALRY